MSHSVVRLLTRDTPGLMRWTILILPMFFYGCFDTQSTAKQSVQGKDAGISSVSRFFTFNQNDSSLKSVETGMAQTSYPYSMGITAVPELAEDASENRIAMPTFVADSQNSAGNHSETARESKIFASPLGRQQSSNFRNAVSLVFNTPFDLIFSKVFKQTKIDGSAQAVKDELPNPFTEARLKQETSSTVDADSDVNIDAEKNKTDSTKQTDAKDSKGEDGSNAAATNPSDPAFPAGSASNGVYFIIGDFNGSGAVKGKSAQRSSNTQFVSDDGVRDFDLYINPDAVEDQRSFYVGDINMDGIPDILTTSEAALFGGVFIGDGARGYQLAGTFVTGYEASIACAGPPRNGMREIVSISVRSGHMRTFQYTDKYRILQTESLDFAPDYVMHLMASDTPLEFALAAQSGGMEQILGWRDDGLLKPTTDQIGADATVLSRDFGSYSLLVYQVGDSASVILTSQGKSFNVANMQLMPGIFLIIGDLKHRGTLDVAVAGLESFVPSQKSR